MSMPVVGHTSLAHEQEPDGERIGTRDREPEPRAPVDLRPRRQKDVQALARLLAPGEDDPVLAPAGRRLVGHEHAVRDDVVLAG